MLPSPELRERTIVQLALFSRMSPLYKTFYWEKTLFQNGSFVLDLISVISGFDLYTMFKEPSFNSLQIAPNDTIFKIALTIVLSSLKNTLTYTVSFHPHSNSVRGNHRVLELEWKGFVRWSLKASFVIDLFNKYLLYVYLTETISELPVVGVNKRQAVPVLQKFTFSLGGGQ